jgi:ribosome-associated protein
MTAKKQNDAAKLQSIILASLDDNKALDIVMIDLKGKSDICEYMIIASGTSSRHISSLADKIVFDLKHKLETNAHISIEGKSDGKWILIDTIDVVTHLFIPEERERYALEELWQI